MLGNVQFLDVVDIANYVNQLLDSRVEFSVDGQYLRTFHQSRLVSESGSKKKARYVSRKPLRSDF